MPEASGFRLSGEVDLSTLPAMDLALDTLLERPGDVTIDLRELTFIDVPGSRLLAHSAIRLRSGGRRLRLRDARPQVRRTLDLLGWTALFDFG